jgi:hypothetical protein
MDEMDATGGRRSRVSSENGQILVVLRREKSFDNAD